MGRRGGWRKERGPLRKQREEIERMMRMRMMEMEMEEEEQQSRR